MSPLAAFFEINSCYSNGTTNISDGRTGLAGFDHLHDNDDVFDDLGSSADTGIDNDMIGSGGGGNDSWSSDCSNSLYRVSKWGAPYFCVNADGHMVVRPFGGDTKPDQEIDIFEALHKILCESREHYMYGIKDAAGEYHQQLCCPVILRFPDVLKHRLECLQSAFDGGIMAFNYQGTFRGVFPVKCNQDRFVVESIVEFGKPYGFGLEAGSKPELLMAMDCLCKGSPDSLLVCNGYKDAEYVCLALMAKRLAMHCVIVLEQEEELDVVLKMAWRLGIEPMIGVRAKLNAKHAGHFGETSGENGKFGLSCSEIVRVVHKLKNVRLLGCLQLLHFHIGSQIPSLDVVREGVSEAAHIFCELVLMGACNMKYLDIGGGLGIDYDGSSCQDSDMSIGYSVEDYAKEVVCTVKDACSLKRVKEPTLCSESGRAFVSQHSILVFDVLSSREKGGLKSARDYGVSLELKGVPLPEQLMNVHGRLVEYARLADYESTFMCARQLKQECVDLFKRGKLNLMQLASVNNMYDVACAMMVEMDHHTLSPMIGKRANASEASLSLGDNLHNTVYHINLSIFKSMPDMWAIVPHCSSPSAA